MSGSLSPARARWSAAGKELRLSSDTSLDFRSCVATANKTPASPTQRIVRASFLWSDVPGCSNIAASVGKPTIARLSLTQALHTFEQGLLSAALFLGCARLASQCEVEHPRPNRKGQGHNGSGRGIIRNRGGKKRNGSDQKSIE